MKDLTQLMELHRSQLASEWPFYWLFDIEVPTDPPTRYRLTNNTRTVTFGTNSLGAPLTYSPFPIAHGGIEQTGEGSLPTIEVSVANVSREISQVLATYGGLVGQPVVVRLVQASELANAQAEIREDAEIRGVRVKNDFVTFTLSAGNMIERKLPPFRIIGTHCRSLYGGPACGYDLTTGTLTTCAKTYEACEAHGADELAEGNPILHPERFNAFPGVRGVVK